MKNKLIFYLMNSMLVFFGFSLVGIEGNVNAAELEEVKESTTLEPIDQQYSDILSEAPASPLEASSNKLLPEGPEAKISGTLAAYGLTEAGWEEATLSPGGFYVKNGASFDYDAHGDPLTGYLGFTEDRLDGLAFSAGTDDNVANRMKYLHLGGDGNTSGMWPVYGTAGIITDPMQFIDRAVYVDSGTGNILTQKSGDTVALQLRGTSKDGRLAMRSTMLNLPDGRVRFIYELTNITNATFNVGFVRKMDFALGGSYILPVFSLGVGKGIYLSNRQFRVLFPRPSDNAYLPNNYEVSNFWSTPFGGRMNGTGDETNSALTLDTEMYFVGDNSLYQKWNVQPLARNATRVISYDLGLQTLSAPVIDVPDSQQPINLKEGQKYAIKGTWVDQDSTKVSLHQKTNAGSFAKFADGTRPESPANRETAFEYTIDASKLNKGKNTIDFKAIDITGLESNIEQVEVNVGNETTLTTRYLNEKSEPIIPDKVETVTSGEFYTTDPRSDYIKENYGYLLHSGKLPSNPNGEAGDTPIEVTYYYNKGLVQLTVKHHDVHGDPIPGVPDETRTIEMKEPYTTSAKDLTAKGYKLKDTPLNANGTAKTEDIVVIYVYEAGELKLVNVPDEIDFGDLKILTYGKKEVFPAENIKVDLLDELPGDWELKLKILKPVVSDISDQPIEGAFKFNPDTGAPVTVTDTAKTIHQKDASYTEDVKLEWDALARKGLYFEQWSGNQKDAYRGTFEWSLVDGL